MVDKIPVRVYCISYKHEQEFQLRNGNLKLVPELLLVNMFFYGTFCIVDVVTII